MVLDLAASVLAMFVTGALLLKTSWGRRFTDHTLPRADDGQPVASAMVVTITTLIGGSLVSFALPGDAWPRVVDVVVLSVGLGIIAQLVYRSRRRAAESAASSTSPADPEA